jgi:tripartite-type tricarboxylate transporter receptor subunit TctC
MVGALQQGQVRALVVSGTRRLALLPNVPTAAEAGLPALSDLSGWNALAGPAGLPEPVVSFWAGVLRALSRDPEWVEATRRLGSVPRVLEPAETRAHVAAQLALYRSLAQRLGLG